MTNPGARPPDGWIPETAREWHEWLVGEAKKTVATYRIKPETLIADYYRERGIARDYEGRELLELLQNANDQAAERGQQGRVVIELSPTGLIVSNTGLPFSVGGVASLQTSHLSPKRHRRKPLIGNKGLGFRAVLNWSQTPIILSDALCLAYCTEYAKNKLNELTQGAPELARLVREEQHGNNALILPHLQFPLHTENGDLAVRLSDKRARKILERCEALLLEGYDTVIGMPFDTASGPEHAESQIDEIQPEILLFAPHLGELSFYREGVPPVTWRREGSDAAVEVLADDQTLGKWQIHRTGGELPASVLEADSGEAINFEIVVAVSIDGEGVPRPLYSYFPTDIALPLPVVCHATLELEQNRKHPQQGRKCNGYVLGKLAESLASIAEEMAARPESDPWAGCSLLIPTGAFPIELEREQFPERLVEFAKTRRIVPTLSGPPTTPDAARSIPGADPSWLPADIFPEVVPLRSDADKAFLDSLGVQPLEAEEIKNRIVAHDDFTTDQRVALIAGLLGQPGLREAYTSALLLDATGAGLGDGMRVILAPSSGEIPRLPDWADLRFLSDDLRAKLAERLEARDGRLLQQKLGEFGLLEYSLANVIRTLVAEANRAEKAHPESRESFQADLLRTVFDIYAADDSETGRPVYPVQSRLHLPNQSHTRSAANTLYAGRGFGPRGEITQALYGSWAPEKLLDLEQLSELTTDREKLGEFLIWIGVAQWPRKIIEPNPDPEYPLHVLRTINYPAQFGDKVVVSAEYARSPFVSDVASVDGLDDILANAEPPAVTAWLVSDDRSLEWARRTQVDAKLGAYPANVYNARFYDGLLPSYVRWRIESTSWLRSIEGQALKPKDSVLGERAIEDLFPRPLMPDQELMDRFGVQHREVLEGWRRAGVLTSLAYLERDEIYAKLLELPQRSPDGALARLLYHWLLDASDTALGGDGPNHEEFLARGTMWGRYGTEGDYFPIGELRHADVDGLPNALLQNLKIVDLRKRVGADKVFRLFGVKSVDRSEIRQHLVYRELAVGSSQANIEFQAAKPYLHMLRASQTSQVTQLRVLKELQLEVCSNLRAGFTFEESPSEHDIPVWGWLIDNKTLYVHSDPARPLVLSESLLADAVGEALASVFRVSGGGDFARMLVCREEDRLRLLERLRGESVLEDVETIKAEYASFDLNTTIEARFPVSEPPVILPKGKDPEVSNSEPGHIIATTDTILSEPSGPLRIDVVPHVPAPMGGPRKLQIKSVTSSGSRSVSQHHVTDGDFCERKAMEFEEASEPARWPVPVGQITGFDGPGCDVLSFSDQEARDAFIRGPTRDLNSVARFIEVKGRGNAAATIELMGNELTAAERYGKRYYLYRLYETEDGSFDLSVLQNPLLHKEALKPSVYVDMERAEYTRRFSLVGGIPRKKVR